MNRYTTLIDGEAGAFGVIFPDLPGCTAMAATVDGAIVNAGEALRDWIAVVEARGGKAPKPRSPDALLGDAETAEALAAGASLATVPLVRDLGRSVKANLSIDAGVLEAIDAAAERLGVTRSAMVEIVARKALPQIA